MRVDHRDLPRVNGDIVPGWENRYADALRNRQMRVDRIRGIAVVEAAATSGGTKTFEGTTNPDGYLREMVQLTRLANGTLPSHCVMGNAAQQLRQDAYEAAARVTGASSEVGRKAACLSIATL